MNIETALIDAAILLQEDGVGHSVRSRPSTSTVNKQLKLTKANNNNTPAAQNTPKIIPPEAKKAGVPKQLSNSSGGGKHKENDATSAFILQACFDKLQRRLIVATRRQQIQLW